MRRVSFHFEGREYVVADEAIEEFETLADPDAVRIMRDVLRQGPGHAPTAGVIALLSEVHAWAVFARALLGGDPFANRSAFGRMPFVLLRRTTQRPILEPPHVDDAPLLSGLAEPDAIDDAWIEVLVVDELDEPIANQAYEIRLSDGRVRTGRTNEHGILRYERVPEGECDVSLVALDTGAWEAA
jgi:hypothetical protein